MPKKKNTNPNADSRKLTHTSQDQLDCASTIIEKFVLRDLFTIPKWKDVKQHLAQHVSIKIINENEDIFKDLFYKALILLLEKRKTVIPYDF